MLLFTLSIYLSFDCYRIVFTVCTGIGLAQQTENQNVFMSSNQFLQC